MKDTFLRHARCPSCRGELELTKWVEEPRENGLGTVVREGVLLCPPCRLWYPIVEFVPVLLDFRSPVHDAFAAQNHARLHALGDLAPPAGNPRPGELSTQRSFTAEWVPLVSDELTFTYTHEDRRDFIRIELDGLPQLTDGSSRPVLDVGCGSGLETELLQDVVGGECIGTDLNLSLLRTGARIAHRPNVHTCIASLFALPFDREAFDLVYSHGVLHHTHSTGAAVDAVAAHVRAGGALVVWVYAKSDFASGVRLRFSAASERKLRPVIARMPAPLQTGVVHALSVPHFAQYRRLGLNRESWHYRNSVHSIRDRWTPRFAHRHERAEVEGWLRRAGLEVTEVDAAAYERRFGIPLIGIGLRGQRPATHD